MRNVQFNFIGLAGEMPIWIERHPQLRVPFFIYPQGILRICR